MGLQSILEFTAFSKVAEHSGFEIMYCKGCLFRT